MDLVSIVKIEERGRGMSEIEKMTARAARLLGKQQVAVLKACAEGDNLLGAGATGGRT